MAWAGPTGGQITSGAGQITQSSSATTIQQSSQTLSLNWQSFDVGSQETVNFLQPNANSVAINHILGPTASQIFGHLNANGQVWLINPNGVLFGSGAQVNVGGLVASSLDLVDDGSSTSRQFRGAGTGSVVNQGTIIANNGGYVALMGHHVSNQGLISAQLGTVALGAGSAQTLTFSGNHLLHLQVDQSELNDLAENRQLIQANGGQVIMTAGAKSSLLASVVNNTGIVQAQTVQSHEGTITLLAGEQAGTVNVGGTLDASAPTGADGGAVETSAAQVNIGASAKVSVSAVAGRPGTWLIDPTDLNIDSGAATTIEGTLNAGGSVTEQTTSSGAGGPGQTSSGPGDINVDAPITWTNAAGSLTLSAYHGIKVNAPINGAGQIHMTASGADVTIAPGASVTGQGGVTLTAAGNFVNDAGAAAVSAGPGAQWLVYSSNPTLDTTGGLIPGFIQYNAPAGTTPAQPNSSGFLYSVAPTVTITGLSGTVSKVYDGTTTAALAGSNLNTTGLLNGDIITAATGAYASADAGSGIGVTSPATASSVTITTGGGVPVYGYALSPTTASAAIGTITPAPLTATIVGTPTKVYDGTTTATLTSSNYSLSGFVGSQGATVKQPSSVSYASADAGSPAVNATFSSTNFTADAGTNLIDYTLPTTATGAGLITRAPVSLTGVLANNKVYDGTTTASLNTTGAGLFGVISLDTGNVSLSTTSAAGTFASANAGNNIGVSLSGFTLTGSKAADYTLVPPSNLSANITPKGLTVTGVATSDKVYDGTTTDSLGFASAQLSGLIAGDTANVALVTNSAAGNFASANAGSNLGVAVTGLALSGSAASNYSLAQPTGLTASISQAPLTITLTGNPTKTYNGTTTAVVSNSDFNISGLVAGQSLAVTQNANAEYATPNAANNIGLTVTLEPSDFSVGSGTSLANYSFSRTVTGTGTINPAVLTGYITHNPTKTYDGTTAATVTSADYVLSGFIGSESITINQPTASYAAKDAGPELVTANLSTGNYTAGGGTLLSNYVLPASLSGSGTIQPAPLGGNYINGSIIGNPTKTYDGNTVATLTPSNFQMTGWVGGDGATVTQTVGQYSSANVGSQAVTANLTSADFSPTGGTNLSNYKLPTVVYGTGTINPAALTVSIVNNPTKVYDGTTSTVLSSSNYSIAGFASGEGASIDPSSLINYASKDVGTNIPISAVLTASAYTANSGTLLSNYVLATTANGTGQITPAPLYVTGVSAQNKTYDTTTAATLSVSGAGLTGLVSGEGGMVSLNTTTSGSFSQADVGNALAVSTSGFSISGSGASNYTLQPVTGLHANITPAPLTVSGVTANSKPYDGTTAATLNASGASLNGILGSDNVMLSSSGAAGTFPTSNVGTGLGVSVSGFSLTGGKAADYSLTQPTGLSANITPAPITVTITGNPTKEYDGSNSATLTASDYTLTGFASGQSATLPQSATANYSTANAGTNVGLQSTLVISDYLAGSGTNLANYSLPSSATGSLGTITPKVLNLSSIRVYDAGTDANSSLFGTLSGLNGDLLTVGGAGTLASKNVGTEGFSSLGTLSLSAAAGNGALASNYTLVGGTDSVRITPASLTVTGAQAVDKVYDGSTAATITGATLSGVLGGDSVQLGNDTSGTFVNKNAGSGKSVSTAMTLGGTDANNYILTQPAGLTASITSLAITVGATGTNRSYNGNVSDAVTLSSSGVIAGDSITFHDTSATFADPNVGNGKTVSVAGISASGADAANYTLNNTTASTTANITAAVINLSGTRVYDAATDADSGLFTSGGTISGVNGENLTLSGSGILTSKNVNPAQAFASLGTLALGNGTGLASNYTLVGGTDEVHITQAPLTVTGTIAANKTYDGTTAASLSSAQLNGVLPGDVVQLGNDTAGTFASKDVGTSIPVSTAMTLSGTDASNYALTQPGALAADISKATITVTATGVNRTYNGGVNDAAILGSSGVVAGDAVTFHDTAATFAGPNVGTGLTVSVAGITATGADAGNYQISNTTATTTADITPAVINLSGTRVYDGATDASASLFTSGGVISGVNSETLTLAGSGILTSKNVNTAQTLASLSTLALGDGTGLASNYTLVGGTDSVNVTKLPITVTATGADKVYNGNTADPGATLASTGVLAGDSLAFTGAATFASKNVNTGSPIAVTVTNIGASGPGSGNYSFNTTATTSANITPKPITVTATGTNIVYNGGVADAVSLNSSGIIPGDTVTYSDSSAIFANPNVGNGKTVSVGGITLGGASAGNYSWNTTTTTTASITPKPITVTATGTDIVYNGGVADPVMLSATGIVSGDTLTFSDTSANFSDKNVGNGKTVTVSGITAGGSDPGNYSINTTATTSANITPAILNLTGARVYDGKTDAAASLFGTNGVLTGVNGETLTLGGSGVLTSKNVNPSQTFASLSGFTLSGNGGAAASNYTLVGGTDSVNITPAPLAVLGTQAANKVYDGNTTATLSGATLAGVIPGDSVELGNNTAGTFNTKDVGTGKTVVSAMTLGGADAGNYSLAQPAGLAANITPKPITVAATGKNKVYDGSTADRVILQGSGIISGDTVTLSSGGANFSTPTVGNDKPITVSGITLSGADAGNYTLANNFTTTSADITPASGIQDTAVAVDYLELAPTAIATPYGVAPSYSPGQLTGNEKRKHSSVERNSKRADFISGLPLRIVGTGVRGPAEAP
jgi:filamentous hemagglutinin family protein